MDEEEYSWANIERPKKDKEEVKEDLGEEPKACSLDDPECLTCGS